MTAMLQVSPLSPDRVCGSWERGPFIAGLCEYSRTGAPAGGRSTSAISGHWPSADGCPFWRFPGPLNDRTSFPHGAIPQEQIDEVLIGHPKFGGQFLEVVYRRNIQPNGDLALELIGVGVLAGLGKIIFASHRRLQYTSSSCLVARLAEISRITESGSR